METKDLLVEYDDIPQYPNVTVQPDLLIAIKDDEHPLYYSAYEASLAEARDAVVRHIDELEADVARLRQWKSLAGCALRTAGE
jgi:hypothetical protein